MEVELLFPKRLDKKSGETKGFTLENLLQILRDDPVHFTCQYENNPNPSGMQLFTEELWEKCSVIWQQVPERGPVICIWDLAWSLKLKQDRTVGLAIRIGADRTVVLLVFIAVGQEFMGLDVTHVTGVCADVQTSFGQRGSSMLMEVGGLFGKYFRCTFPQLVAESIRTYNTLESHVWFLNAIVHERAEQLICELSGAYENNSDAVGADWSESSHYDGSVIHHLVRWVSASSAELGFHDSWHYSWLLVTRKGIMIFDPFCGSGGLVIAAPPCQGLGCCLAIAGITLNLE